ncbi:MAG: bifunctional methylenetetrahydrofolate dehydrogenase/methenyltetrahydrofolate cyclohydrolase [Actinomycetota bacterium]|nr:bifunctional methylenetetrahydrofolate dehydrogenase/methenyltetrahydrofolate cyclohydrolase [Actinomycetota bacterium]
MTAKILDGNAVAASIKEKVKAGVAELAAVGKGVGLGTILVGDDPSSAKYVAMKHRDCEEVGIASIHRHLAADISQAELMAVIDELNSSDEVDSVLLQLPLPSGLDQLQALLAISPAKDVDGLHPVNLGKLVMNEPGPLPCTPAGIVELLTFYGVEVEHRHVVMVGRGLTIGRPLAMLLSAKRKGCNATVTIAHTGTADLGEITRQGDIVIAAAGVAGLIRGDMIKPGAVVVGAGTPFVNGKLSSDLDPSVAEAASAVTPTIGGVGPMTRAMLLVNALRAAKARVAGEDAG